MKKQLVEAMRAIGYCGGEITEITKDGFGIEDLKSVKDLIDNKDILVKGFDFEGKVTKEGLKDLGLDALVEIVMAAKEGYALGLK